jgi:RNA polymerase sigma-70 factor (ECF subfamily)
MFETSRQTQAEIDAQLLQETAQGNEASFSALYDRFCRPLYSLAYRMLGNDADANDVVQELFIRLWERAYAFDPSRGSAFSWAAGMMRLRAIDRIRARQRRSRLLEQASHELPHIHFASNQSALSPNGSPASPEALNAILTELTPEQREAIELAFFQGLTHPEIAERLKTPLGTVKARIRRGLSRLKEHMQDHL